MTHDLQGDRRLLRNRKLSSFCQDASSCQLRAAAHILPNIFAEILRTESKLTANCLTNHSISLDMREEAISQMLELISDFGMALETFFLSVKLMDFFLCKTKTCYTDDSIFVLAKTCIFIASKFEEVQPLTKKIMVETIGKGLFSEEKLLLAEKTILQEVDYNLHFLTPLSVVSSLTSVNLNNTTAAPSQHSRAQPPAVTPSRGSTATPSTAETREKYRSWKSQAPHSSLSCRGSTSTLLPKTS